MRIVPAPAGDLGLALFAGVTFFAGRFVVVFDLVLFTLVGMTPRRNSKQSIQVKGITSRRPVCLAVEPTQLDLSSAAARQKWLAQHCADWLNPEPSCAHLLLQRLA